MLEKVKRWSTRIIIGMIFCSCVLGVLGNAKKVFQDNIYVWTEDQERKALSFFQENGWSIIRKM